MAKCEVTEVLPLCKSREHPVIANFQHGVVKPEGAAQMECLRAKQHDQKIVLAAVANNVYSGVVGEGFSSGLMRNFIGIRNKVTNKIRLIEVEECSLISKHYDVDKPQGENITRTADQTFRKLMTEFGGKTANRHMERKERMLVNVDIVKDQLDKTMNESLPMIKQEKDEFDVAKEFRDSHLEDMLPKFNKDATELRQVFTVTDLISGDLLDRMESDAINVLQTERQDLPIASEYLHEIIDQCRQSKEPDSERNLKIVKICIYIDALITFQKNLRGVTETRNVRTFSRITEKVENHIRTNFTQPASMKITTYIVHKVISYAIVLSLIVCGKYEICLNSLITALRFSKVKLLALVKVLPVRYNDVKNTLTLTLPSKKSITRSKPLGRKRRH